MAAASWSSVETASRNEPRAPRAISDRAESGAWIPSPSATRRRQRHELGKPRPLEGERLTARTHGRDDLDEVGRAEDEQEVGRGLFDQLQQRVPGGIGELVRLVEDVDLVAPLDRLQDHALADLANVVDPALRSGVHLDHVEGGAVGDRHTYVAGLVRGWRGSRRAHAVESLRENPRHRRLSGAARSGEEIRLSDLVVLDRVLERPHDRLLPDDLVEALRAVLPIERGHPADSSR